MMWRAIPPPIRHSLSHGEWTRAEIAHPPWQEYTRPDSEKMPEETEGRRALRPIRRVSIA